MLQGNQAHSTSTHSYIFIVSIPREREREKCAKLLYLLSFLFWCYLPNLAMYFVFFSCWFCGKSADVIGNLAHKKKQTKEEKNSGNTLSTHVLFTTKYVNILNSVRIFLPLIKNTGISPVFTLIWMANADVKSKKIVFLEYWFVYTFTIGKRYFMNTLYNHHHHHWFPTYLFTFNSNRKVIFILSFKI